MVGEEGGLFQRCYESVTSRVKMIAFHFRNKIFVVVTLPGLLL